MRELDQIYKLARVNSKVVDNELNNFITQSSQKESVVDTQNFVFDYQRFGNDLKIDDLDFKNFTVSKGSTYLNDDTNLYNITYLPIIYR